MKRHDEIASPIQDRGGLAMTVLRPAAEKLRASGIVRPRWTAEQLLSHRLGCAPIDLYLEESPPSVIAGSEIPLPVIARLAKQGEAISFDGLGTGSAISFQADVAARAGGVPLQYLLGTAEFYGREFFVGPGVFIPRPETEVLVEVALDGLRAYQEPVLLDVGTGCGAMAVTLALEHPKAYVLGSDLSACALSFARRNANRYGVKVSFLQGKLVESLALESVDCIVANLPYLNPQEVPTWPRELHWEPWVALDGGEEGLSLIKALIRQAASVLRPGGRLILEIGESQSNSVREIARPNGLSFERIVPDLAGLERVVILAWDRRVEEVC